MHQITTIMITHTERLNWLLLVTKKYHLNQLDHEACHLQKISKKHRSFSVPGRFHVLGNSNYHKIVREGREFNGQDQVICMLNYMLPSQFRTHHNIIAIAIIIGRPDWSVKAS